MGSPANPGEDRNSKGLIISFLLMVFVGWGNKIFQVLMFIPMKHYPLFVNLLTTFVYLPVSFAYIWPMLKWGTAISPEAQAIPKSKFAMMGFLDSLAGIMQTLAVNQLQKRGSLVILLSQSTIPVSMVLSYIFLKAKYTRYHLLGASLVAVGLIIVLMPSFISKSTDAETDDVSGLVIVIWALVFIASSVPMCLSSIYKEKALGDVDIDAIYMNGWIAVFQFLFSIPLLFPSAPASDVKIKDLGTNLRDGWKCLWGINTILTGDKPDNCSMSPYYVFIYLFFNVNYNILILLILKYGSANLLWMAMTIMVPLGNITFAFKFVPGHRAMKPTDIISLFVIMSGLISYRFLGKLLAKPKQEEEIGGGPGGPLLYPAAIPSEEESEQDAVVGINSSSVAIHRERRSTHTASGPEGRSLSRSLPKTNMDVVPVPKYPGHPNLDNN